MLWTAAPSLPVDTAAGRPAPGTELLVRPLDDLPCDPLAVVASLAHLAGRRRLVALSGNWSDGSTIISADPVRIIEARDAATTAALLVALDDLPQLSTATPPGAVGGGWIGLLGHAVGTGLDTVSVDAAPVRGPHLPLLAFGWYDHVLRFDGVRWWAEGFGDGGLAAATSLADQARPAPTAGSMAGAAPPAPSGPPATGLRSPDATAHMAAVEHAVTAIRTGQVVQTTICSRYEFHVKQPVTAWTALVRRLAPDHAALITGPWGALLGASPELYLRRRGRDVESAPIKGTSPPDRDAAQLRHSAKDIAENLMIVDLVRNDLSRVCVPGSVATPELLRVQPQTGVSHLVSRVTGRLRGEVGDAGLITATFPPGSVTGAPKLRATELSNRLESVGRGAHTGAVGLISPVTGLELAVTIRSVEVRQDGAAALGVGSGITVGSTPAAEWAECTTKAAPLLAALGLTPPADSPHTASRKGLADPGAGLIETVLVVDGRPIAADDHAERLRRSFAEVYGRPLRGDPTAVLRAAAPADGSYRMRLLAVPAAGAGADEIRIDVLRPWPLPPSPADRPGLQAATVTGPVHGLERHKYADRTWWQATDAAAAVAGAPVDVVIVTDATGALLEGSLGNVFAIIDGGLVTPQADGRILPGTARQQLVDEAVAAGVPVTLRPLGRAEVARAHGLLLVNALRGVTWLRCLDTPDGTTSWPSVHPLAVELGERLIARWLGTTPP